MLYGSSRRSELDAETAPENRLRVALVQGSFDTIFEEDRERDDAIFARYLELSEQAIAEHPEVDLIVWPESAFTGTLGEVLVDGPIQLPANVPLTQEEANQRADEYAQAFQDKTRAVAAHLNRCAAIASPDQHHKIHMIVGTDTQRLGPQPPRRYNSALHIAPDGHVVGRYFKIHRVMFGEYIPLGDTFPWIYDVTPMTHGLTPGQGPQIFEVSGTRLSPSICFESTVPDLIRRQLATLRDAGTPPNVLVSVTNDGWFWGSNLLDLHLACAVFRAIEHRIPMVIAANTGFSAHIDRNGAILDQGPRRDEAVIFAEVGASAEETWYQTFGDLPAAICLLFCLAVAVIGLAGRRSRALRNKTLE
jgi:apolipoprotein N-acyltransferase